MVLWIHQPDWSDTNTTTILHDALTKAFWDLRELQEIWQTIGLSPGEIEWSGPAVIVWRTLTREAAQKHKLEELVRLVRSRKPAVAVDLDVVLAARLSNSAWYRCADRYQARLVGPGSRRPLVDRSQLSAALRSVDKEKYPVLSISGDPGSGKSHSRYLIQHVAGSIDVDATLILVDIADEWQEGNDIDAVDFVARLARRLGMPADFHPDLYTECHRTAKELSSDFVGRFRTLPQIYRWIFIDGLDRPNVTTAVHGFVRNLAKEVDNNQLGQTRLIVTGHPGDFPPTVQDVLQIEQIEPIDTSHIAGFFYDIAQHIGADLDDAALDRLVKDVLAEASLVDLRSLGRRASQIAHHHFAGVSPG
ncbi:effector-associated domain EAD1-containing protein [Micromonospora sp. WMMD735]|uniref:effector-associated domain EAD1-containing protein n=1 Tax=Micromonospora sp. WMMD735 TaxID=3404130 RepID=UPI003B951C5D